MKTDGTYDTVSLGSGFHFRLNERQLARIKKALNRQGLVKRSNESEKLRKFIEFGPKLRARRIKRPLESRVEFFVGKDGHLIAD